MKPVIVRKSRYTLMLMRDDGAARSFSIRGGVLRLCLYLFCLLLAAGGAGVYVGAHYRYKTWNLSGEVRRLEQTLAETRVRLEELSTVKTIASTMSDAPPASLNADFSGHDAVGKPAAQAPSSEILSFLQTGAAAGAQNGRGTDEPRERNATEAVAAPAAGAEQGADAALAVPDPAEHPAPVSTAPAPPLLSDPDSPVRIINFLAQNSGNRRLRLRFDLISQEQQPVSGQVHYQMVLRNGTRQDLDIPNGESVRFFAISRMKQMDGTARLPQGVDIAQIRAVDVLVTLDNGPTYHEEHPVGD